MDNFKTITLPLLAAMRDELSNVRERVARLEVVANGKSTPQAAAM